MGQLANELGWAIRSRADQEPPSFELDHMHPMLTGQGNLIDRTIPADTASEHPNEHQEHQQTATCNE